MTYPYYIESNSYKLFISLKDIKEEKYKEVFSNYTFTSDYWEADLKNAREIYYGYDKEIPKIEMYTRFEKEHKEGEGAVFVDGKVYFYNDFFHAAHSVKHEYTHYLQFIQYADAPFSNEQRPITEGYAVEYHMRSVASL